MNKIKLGIHLLLLSLLLLITTSADAQLPKEQKEKSDPEATKILKKLKKSYEKYEGVEIKYSLELGYGDEKEIQEGVILQEGEKYFMENDGNLIINDGKSVWVYTKKQNTVQISDYDPDDAPLTPAKFLGMDENNEDFVYAITGEDANGYNIEFKPVDKNSDIRKIRINVDKAQTKINLFILFHDDGTRMDFTIKSIKNTKLSSSTFTFNKDKYPGVKVVNLKD